MRPIVHTSAYCLARRAALTRRCDWVRSGAHARLMDVDNNQSITVKSLHRQRRRGVETYLASRGPRNTATSSPVLDCEFNVTGRDTKRCMNLLVARLRHVYCIG